MSFKLRFLTLAAAMLGMLAMSSMPQAETLQGAIKYMINTHPDIRTVVYNRLGRDQQVKQARYGYFPKLDFIAGVGTERIDEPVHENLNPVEFKLSLRQNIFAGLSTTKEVDRQKARVLSEAYLIQSTTENTALKAAKAYLDVLRHQELLTLAKENLAIHQRIGDQIKLRSQSGISGKGDMDQVESRLSLALSNVVVAKTNLADSRTNYLALIGHLPENLVKPVAPDSSLPKSLKQAEQDALAMHPTLKSAEADLEAREDQDAVARAPFMPIIDLEVDRTWNNDVNTGLSPDEDNTIAMLRFRYNLFNGWKDRARKLETTQLISEAREIRNHTHRQVVESIRLSWMAYQAVTERIHYLKDRVKSSTATAQSYTKQWNIGRRTLLDVLDAEAERIDSKKDLLNARYDGIYAEYRILNGMGSLVHTLGLQWPKEAYVNGQNKAAGKPKNQT